MNCSECRAHLHAYLDQELDLPSVVAIDQHLAACAECKALFAGQLALRSGIRRHAEYHEAPSALAARIRERIASGDSDTYTIADALDGRPHPPAPASERLPFIIRPARNER